MPTFQATSKAANAPTLPEGYEPGIFDLRFDGTEEKRMKTGQYVKDPVNGDPKLEWGFTILDDEGEPLYSEGDPLEVTSLTGVNFNIVSKTVPGEVKMLKALLTKAEFDAFLDGKGTEEKKLLGRIVQGEVFVKESGYLGVSNIIPARKRSQRPAAAAETDAGNGAEVDEE